MAIGIYVVLVLAGILVLSPGTQPGFFFAYLVVLTLLFIAVCWAKGEPPRWRWGNRNRT